MLGQVLSSGRGVEGVEGMPHNACCSKREHDRYDDKRDLTSLSHAPRSLGPSFPELDHQADLCDHAPI